jgi:hypothetical protein
VYIYILDAVYVLMPCGAASTAKRGGGGLETKIRSRGNQQRDGRKRMEEGYSSAALIFWVCESLPESAQNYLSFAVAAM